MQARQHPTNLATELSSFIGREDSLAEIARAFADGARLVTIFGAPGTGKTRVARRHGVTHAATKGGAWFCDLTSARSRADIATTVGAALDVPLTIGSTEDDAIAQLGRVLASRDAPLLILDNFEQVVAHAQTTLGIWLEQAPHAVFLATSREVLGVEAEQRIELLPLKDDAASELFMTRARQAGRRVGTSDEDAALVREIVERLDGIPLAIELAASRASMLSLLQLRDRLAQRLEWLRSDRRDLAQRHATLRGAIAWSWTLLDEDEKSALAQCAAFRRSFSLEAAESILRLPPASATVFDTLQSLRNKSLIRADEGNGELRFDLYETIRDFALEQLATVGEDAGLQARHAAFFLKEGASWAKDAHGSNGTAIRARLAAERDNLIVAHAHFLSRDLPSAVALVLILEPLFSTRGPLEPFLRLVDQSLKVAENSADPRSHATLLRTRAEIDRQRGKAKRAQSDLEKALALVRDSHEEALEGEVLGLLGLVRWQLRSIEDAEACTRSALAIHTKVGNKRLAGMCFGQLGVIAGFRQSFDEARSLLSRAREMEREEGDLRYEGIAAHFLANTLFEQGDLPRAQQAYEEALHVLRETDNRRYQGVNLYALGLVEMERGRMTESLAALEESLRLLRAVGDERLEGVVQTGLGHHAFERRAFEEAIARYDEGAALLLELGGDPRYEGLALAYAGAAAASLDRVEDAEMAISSARARVAGIGDAVAIAVVDVLKGFVSIASARRARARGDEEAARAFESDATTRANPTNAKTSLVRAAARFLQRDIGRTNDGATTPQPMPETFAGLEVGPRAEWFKRPDADRVDLTRRPKLRLLLEALVEKRVASPGDPAHPEWLMTQVWPHEKILPDAASSRLYVAVATLRKLGLHDVIITQTEGYLLHAAVPLRTL